MYADDILLILFCYDKQSLLNNSFRITNRIKNKLKDKKLEVECNKSEATLLYAKKVDREDAKIQVGEDIIKPKDNMRYLGFQFGKNFNMSCHINTVCEKAR